MLILKLYSYIYVYKLRMNKKKRILCLIMDIFIIRKYNRIMDCFGKEGDRL